MIAVLLLAHVVVGATALVGGRRLGRRAWPMVAIAPALVLGWLVLRRSDVEAGISSRLDWVPQLGLQADLRVDPFSALMLVLVSGVGLLVVAYAWSYFGGSDSAGRAAGLLTLFAGSMFGVVVADNLLVLVR